MDVTIQNDHIAKVCGIVDMGNAAQFGERLQEAAERAGGRLIIDLTDVNYIDSVGLAVILTIYQRVRRQGNNLVVVTGNPNIREILGMMHADMLPGFIVRDDLASAEAAA